MSFLETGRALYLLAAICLGGIMVRLAAGSFYKRLIRESSNLALAKNRYLRALRQNAEDTYRINMGMNNTRVYLERQIYTVIHKHGGHPSKDTHNAIQDNVVIIASVPIGEERRRPSCEKA